jgi:uncharacterized membrane protein YccC
MLLHMADTSQADGGTRATASMRDTIRPAFHVDWANAEPLAALRCTVGVAVPLTVAIAWLGPVAASFVAVGAVATGFGSFQGAYRSRAAIMLLCNAGMAVSMFAGSLAGYSTMAAAIVGAAWGFVAGLAVSLGPGAAFVALQSAIAALVAVAYPASFAESAWRSLLVVSGGLFQILLVVSLWPLKRFRPERRVIAAAYRSIAGFAATLSTGSPSAPEPHTMAETDAVQLDPHPLGRSGERLVFQALLDEAERLRESLAALSIVSPLPEPVAASVAALLREIGDAVDEARAPEADDREWGTVETATLPHPAGHARLEVLLGQLRAAFRLAATPAAEPATPARRRAKPVPALPPIRDGLTTLWANLSLDSSACRHGLRLAATLALAAAAAHAFDMPRGYWASITVLLVLKPEFGETYVRGVGRIVGTLAGAGLVVALVATLGRHPAAITPLLLLFIWSGYLLFRVNYAAFTLCITGYIVLLLYLAGVSGQWAAEYRALNTILGGALALMVYRVWPTWEARHVGDAFATVADAFARDIARVLDTYVDPVRWNVAALDETRTAARLARSNAEASVMRLLAEPRRERFEPQLASSLVAAFRRFAAGGLALHADLQQRPSAVPELAGLRDQVASALASLAATLRSGSPPDPVPPMRETFLRTRETLSPAAADALDLVIDSVETAVALAGKGGTARAR